MTSTAESLVLDRVRSYPDFPKPGILFRDLSALFAESGALAAVAQELIDELAVDGDVHAVVGVESRGFTIAAAMAMLLGCGVVPVRKAGKLPGETLRESYALEYGDDELELQRDILPPGSRVLLVDDLLATGGTLAASVRLLERAGFDVVGIGVVLELDGLDGRAAVDGPRLVSITRLPA